MEALDGGDLKNKVPFRDKVVSLAAPFSGQPTEVVPYKILPSAVEAIKQVVSSRLKLFNGLQ